MQSRITGTTMPVLEFVLEPNESIISEAGELSWMGSSIEMTTHTQFGGGGLFGVLKRVAGGGSIFMTEYRAIGAAGEVAFATKLPGHIVPVEVAPGHAESAEPSHVSPAFTVLLPHCGGILKTCVGSSRAPGPGRPATWFTDWLTARSSVLLKQQERAGR